MRYRVHRMKDTPRENFRWAPHTGGLATVRIKDYEAQEEIDAVSPYAAWKLLLNQARPLRPGDLLEPVPDDGATGELQIAKYIGFEPAQWFIPEIRPHVSESEGDGASI